MGMHWGIRRYQNKDGTLTAEGRNRLKTDAKFKAKVNNYKQKDALKAKGVKGIANYLTRRYMEPDRITGHRLSEEEAIEKAQRNAKIVKTAIGVVAGVGAAGAAATIPAAAVFMTSYSRFKQAQGIADSVMNTAMSEVNNAASALREAAGSNTFTFDRNSGETIAPEGWVKVDYKNPPSGKNIYFGYYKP